MMKVYFKIEFTELLTGVSILRDLEYSNRNARSERFESDVKGFNADSDRAVDHRFR
jgi:hypothetical protein